VPRLAPRTRESPDDPIGYFNRIRRSDPCEASFGIAGRGDFFPYAGHGRSDVQHLTRKLDRLAGLDAMKRPRPYIPLRVRVAVAERQFVQGMGRIGRDFIWSKYLADRDLITVSERLRFLLWVMFDGPSSFQLDHNPALILREFNEKTGKYTPDANDPDHLVYRTKEDHQQKTTGRKPGAERTVTTKGSDIGLKRKFAKLEKRTKASRRPKQKIPSRPFPKQKRKFR
jgi:hypothetical protein